MVHTISWLSSLFQTSEYGYSTRRHIGPSIIQQVVTFRLQLTACGCLTLAPRVAVIVLCESEVYIGAWARRIVAFVDGDGLAANCDSLTAQFG